MDVSAIMHEPKTTSAGEPCAQPRKEACRRLGRLARRLFDVPAACVVSADRGGWVLHHGPPLLRKPDAWDLSQHALGLAVPLVVEDLSADARFTDQAQASKEAGLRFIAGLALNALTDGHTPAFLFILDVQPRRLGREEQALLLDLADLGGKAWDALAAAPCVEGQEAPVSSAYGQNDQETRHQTLREAPPISVAPSVCRDAMERHPEPILIHVCSRIVYANTAGARLVGLAGPDEMLGRSLDRLIVADPQALNGPGTTASVAGRIFTAAEYRIRRVDGEERRVTSRSLPVRYDGQRAVQVILRDITEQKRTEAAMEQLNAALEQRVRERTAELEAANQELEAFAYSVSHDLRAPLRAIHGFSRILIDDYLPELSPKAGPYLSKIKDNALSMGVLLDDLLRFSRLSRHALERQTVDPATLVRQALEELEPMQRGRSVAVTVGALPPCEADPRLLKQVYVNLLSNALKFSVHCEAAKIEVGASNHDGTVIYSVADTGVGFDQFTAAVYTLGYYWILSNQRSIR